MKSMFSSQWEEEGGDSSETGLKKKLYSQNSQLCFLSELKLTFWCALGTWSGSWQSLLSTLTPPPQVREHPSPYPGGGRGGGG